MPLDASNSKADQSVSAKDEFNAKIVEHSELKAEQKRLVKANFTFKEKVILAVSKPLTQVRGIKLALKIWTDSSVQQQLSDQSPDGSLGVYRDDQKKIYANGAYINMSYKLLFNDKSAETIYKKAEDLTIQAFKNCQDHKNKPDLRPL